MEFDSSIHDDNYWKKRDISLTLLMVFQAIVGLPKSIIFNLHYFGIKGLSLPVLCSSNVKLTKMRGKVVISPNIKTAGIKLGFTNSEMFKFEKKRLNWINDGLIEFRGKAGIHSGSIIRNYGHLIFGADFHVSSPSTIICYKKIQFGDDVLIGWNCEFMDGDAHKVFRIDSDGKERLNIDKSIKIGNHVWVASGVRVLKGSSTGNNTIIASGSILTKPFTDNNVVIGGNPARILKKDVDWKV